MTKFIRLQRQSVLAYGLLALPVAFFALLWQRYAVNVPKWDDHALRHFLYLVDQETTFSGKLHQFLKQHNEHRIVYDRLVSWLDYQLTGKLNFRHLMVIGNLSLVGLLAVFAAVLRRAGRPLLYAVPVAFLLFNLSQWENMYWGMAALQNFSVVLWVVAACYVLAYRNRIYWAVGLALLATLTSGNGMLVWPIGFGMLLLRLAQPHANRRPLLIWSLSGLIGIGLYFIGFAKPADTVYIQADLPTLLGGWFAFMGAAGEVLPATVPLRVCMALGGFMTVAALVLIGWTALVYRTTLGRSLSRLFQTSVLPTATPNRPLPPSTLFFWSVALFLLVTGLVVARARVGFGLDLLMTSRYKLYSLCLLALLYTYTVVWVEGQTGRWLMRVSLVGGLVFAWLSYLSFIDDTIWWRHWLTTNQFNWRYSTSVPVSHTDAQTDQYIDPAPAFYTRLLPVLYQSPAGSPVPVQVTQTPVGFDVVQRTLAASPMASPDAGAYVVARSAARTYLFPVRQQSVTPTGARFRPSRLFGPGFRSGLTHYELDAGTYQLLILVVGADGTAHLYPTNQQITSTGPPADTTKKNW